MANNFLGGLFGDRDDGAVNFILILCLFCCLCGGDDGLFGRGGGGGGDLLLPILLLLACCGDGCGRRGRGRSDIDNGCNIPVL